MKFTKNRERYLYVSDDKTVGLNNSAGRKDFGKPVFSKKLGEDLLMEKIGVIIPRNIDEAI